MRITETDYVNQLWALLPPGPAWDRELNPDLAAAFTGWAAALFKADDQVTRMMEEADPRTASELFEDWERAAGLPDACAVAFGGVQSLGQRRAALLGRLTSKGGTSRAYYLSVMAALGYAATITEFQATGVGDDVSAPMYGEAWEASWQINAALNVVTVFDVTGDVESPLAWWGSALLECVLNRLNRAGATLVFKYS